MGRPIFYPRKNTQSFYSFQARLWRLIIFNRYTITHTKILDIAITRMLRLPHDTISNTKHMFNNIYTKYDLENIIPSEAALCPLLAIHNEHQS
jgi:hypothetical protein